MGASSPPHFLPSLDTRSYFWDVSMFSYSTVMGSVHAPMLSESFALWSPLAKDRDEHATPWRELCISLWAVSFSGQSKTKVQTQLNLSSNLSLFLHNSADMIS